MNPIEIKRLDHVQVCIPHGAEEVARQFYAGVLGLAEIEKPEALKPNGGLWFEAGDIQLHLGTENIVAVSKRHPAFEVTDLAAAREWLAQHEVRLQDETAIPGCERFTFFDPFGNRIEFLQKSVPKQFHALTSRQPLTCTLEVSDYHESNGRPQSSYHRLPS